MKDRDTTFDIMKGIGIALMVIGHSGAPFRDYIYLFHMPLFFMISGYLWNCHNADNIDKIVLYAKKKIKTLWVPYVVINVFFVVTNNLFLQLGIYTSDDSIFEIGEGTLNCKYHMLSTVEIVKEIGKNLMFYGEQSLGGATWFFRSLFLILIFHTIVMYVLKDVKEEKRIVLCIIGAMIGTTLINMRYEFVMKVMLHLRSLPFFAGYLAFLIGYCFKKIMKRYPRIFCKNLYSVPLIGGCIFILTLMSYVGKIELVTGECTNILFYCICCISGWFLCYSLAVRIPEFLKKIFSMLGKNTVEIVLFHFLAFKLVTFLYVFVTNSNRVLLAQFPVIYSVDYLWVPYTICGIVFPLCVAAMKKRVIGKMRAFR